MHTDPPPAPVSRHRHLLITGRGGKGGGGSKQGHNPTPYTQRAILRRWKRNRNPTNEDFSRPPLTLTFSVTPRRKFQSLVTSRRRLNGGDFFAQRRFGPWRKSGFDQMVLPLLFVLSSLIDGFLEFVASSFRRICESECRSQGSDTHPNGTLELAPTPLFTMHFFQRLWRVLAWGMLRSGMA